MPMRFTFLIRTAKHSFATDGGAMVDLTKRTAGILMHISSLSSEYGIGTFGKAAYDFVRLLKKAGQTYWQILPLGPTGYGDSPYQCLSAFAGNPFYIDIELLIEDGLLTYEDVAKLNFSGRETAVDFRQVKKGRKQIFQKVFDRFLRRADESYARFCDREAYWLDNYALFAAIKETQNNASLFLWEDAYKLRDENTLMAFIKSNRQKIEYHRMLQFLFFKQWNALKKYANENGIYIIGDIPIYVSSDSADVWSQREIFQADKNLTVRRVAGCPPDAFSKDGQLWGNVVYDWLKLKKTDYAWWLQRLEKSFEMYDVLRIDHFRAFDSYYSVRAQDKTARDGKWFQGPGMDFWNAVGKKLGKLPIIAEDLGFLTPSVKKLLADCGFPGMKILQFAFDSREESDYLPHNYEKNSVVYTGTHDNNTIKGWEQTAKKEDIDYARRYFRLGKDESLSGAMMLSALSSVSNICILTMQDLLGLGAESRMNTPSTVGGNWQWRATKKQLLSFHTDELYYYTKLYGRLT